MAREKARGKARAKSSLGSGDDKKKARETGMTDIVYDEVFNALPEEKRPELIGRKAGFAEKAGISL